jgi:phospholipid/cholesterol/gamma-HCH transport system substrate-binding protein
MPSARLIGVGAFVIAGGLLFALGLFMIGDRRSLFEDNFEVYAEFSKLAGLEGGATVRVAGLDAGEVTAISVPTGPASRFRVRVRIREELHAVVRSDSVASIQTEGLVGNKFVQIEGGSEASPRAPAGSTIQSRDPIDIADLLQQLSGTLTLVDSTIEELKGDVLESIRTINATAGAARDLVVDSREDVKAITLNARRVADDMRGIMDAVNEGRGTVGRLLHDDSLYRDAQRIAGEAEQVVANLRQVTEQAREAIGDFTGKVKGKDGQAQALAADLRQTLVHARDAMADLAENAEALKRNFLFRGYFNRRGYFDLDDVSPEAYRSNALAGKDRKVLRIWLDASYLFEKNPQGNEQLTDTGRARLDSAMSQFLKYPPLAPLVIEGYADEATADQRYLVARHRAAAVREYLIARFTLDSNRVAIMPLGNERPEGAVPPDGMATRGVALALFVPR